MARLQFPKGQVIAFYRVLNRRPTQEQVKSRFNGMLKVVSFLEVFGLQTDLEGTYDDPLNQDHLYERAGSWGKSISKWGRVIPDRTLPIDMAAAELQVIDHALSNSGFLEHFEFRANDGFDGRDKAKSYSLMKAKGLEPYVVRTGYRSNPRVREVLNRPMRDEEIMGLLL